jgi:hypothetical protein
MTKELISENIIRKVNLIEYRRSVRVLKEEIHNRLKEYCFKRLDKFLLDGSEQITHSDYSQPDYPHSIFFKRKSDGRIIAEIDKENEYFFLDYEHIWSFFEYHFNLKYEEIQEIANDWLDETFKLNGYRSLHTRNHTPHIWIRLSN